MEEAQGFSAMLVNVVLLPREQGQTLAAVFGRAPGASWESHRSTERFGLQGNLKITQFPWAATPPTTPGCSKPDPTWKSRRFWWEAPRDSEWQMKTKPRCCPGDRAHAHMGYTGHPQPLSARGGDHGFPIPCSYNLPSHQRGVGELHLTMSK